MAQQPGDLLVGANINLVSLGYCHTRIFAMMEASRCQSEQDSVIPEARPDSSLLCGIDVAVGAGAVLHHTVEDSPPTLITSGVGAGTTSPGFVWTIFSQPTNSTKAAVVGRYFVKYATLNNFTPTAFPVVQYYP